MSTRRICVLELVTDEEADAHIWVMGTHLFDTY